MSPHLVPFLALLAGCGGVTWALIELIRPVLLGVALARPNARSGHVVPTPQGAGLAIIPVTVAGVVLALCLTRIPAGLLPHLIAAAIACLALMVLGFLDDSRSISIAVRLFVHFAAALAVVATLPDAYRLTILPLWIERTLLVVAVVWAVNLTNFMDGMDWLAASEAVAICVGVIGMVALGAAPLWLAGAAVALLGAVIGFMPANAPTARIFLGDAGSLPLGFILALLLLHLALAGQPAAAAILPLYFLADASVTLLRRALRRRRFWMAHREHFYQRALAAGASIPRVLAVVAVTNTALIVIALVTAWAADAQWSVFAFLLAGALVLLLLVSLVRSRSGS